MNEENIRELADPMICPSCGHVEKRALVLSNDQNYDVYTPGTPTVCIECGSVGIMLAEKKIGFLTVDAFILLPPYVQTHIAMVSTAAKKRTVQPTTAEVGHA